MIDRKGFVNWIVSILVLSVVAVGFTLWNASFYQGVADTHSDLDALSIAKMEWEKLNQMGLHEILAEKDTLSAPYKIGDFTVQITVGEKGRFKNGKCAVGEDDESYIECLTDSYISVSKEGEVLYKTKTVPLSVGNHSKRELDDLLGRYVKNNEFNSVKGTGLLSAKVISDDSGRVLEIYSDGEQIPLYPKKEFLGPPDMTRRTNLSLPWTVPETGYIFLHQTSTGGGQTKINAVTAEGLTVEGLLSFNIEGMLWAPVSKGDYLYFVSKNSTIDTFYFVPCIKTDI